MSIRNLENQNKRLWAFFETFGPELLAEKEMESFKHYLETGNSSIKSSARNETHDNNTSDLIPPRSS